MLKLISCIGLLMLIACGSGGGSNPSPDIDDTPSSSDDPFSPDYSNLKPYIGDSPYADALAGCVAVESESESCTIEQLPPIGLNHPAPTVEDIMDHVVVSHDWMGRRLEDLLYAMPADIMLMFRATTAIVIDDDIRPAHYRALTGAIYIDPAFLWLSNEEKATISQHQDFRSDFGNDLQFKRRWRYVINNRYAWESFPLTGNEERTLEDTLISTSWLFYHELAHANDCLPPNEQETLNQTISFYLNYVEISSNQRCVHDQLVAQSPLTSSIWYQLATVLYHGDDSTSEQRALTPIQVGQEFESDIAHDTYSYSSVWEDTAMAFEAILMKLNFNADRDMVIVPYYDEFSCEAALVKWGQRGRLGDPNLITRAQFVVSQMLPELDLTEFYADQPLPTEIPSDISYCSLDLSGNIELSSADHKLITEREKKQEYYID